MDGVLDNLPALSQVSRSVDSVSGSVRYLADNVNKAVDVPAALSAVAEALARAIYWLDGSSEEVPFLASNISQMTDNSVIRLDEYELEGVNDGLRLLSDREDCIYSALSGESSGGFDGSPDLKGVVEGLESESSDMARLTEAFENLYGDSSAMFAMAFGASGFTSAFTNLSKSSSDLSTAISSKVGELDDATMQEDLTSVAKALKKLSEKESNLVNAIKKLSSCFINK